MSIPRYYRYLALPVLSLSLLAAPAHASSSTPRVVSPSNAASSQTYDQIVRLSLVEGDVRVSRGKEGEHATGGAWGEAVANLPIESGFSLVTGTGRAEIEFEDASTIYLGDNSVLTFDQPKFSVATRFGRWTSMESRCSRVSQILYANSM